MKVKTGTLRRALLWLAATGMAGLATAALVSLGATSTTAGMVFLVLVVWSATRAGRWLSLYIALLCALSFDYFLLLPYHTLRLAGGQEWVAMLSFVASCVVVSRVAELARRQTRQAEQRRADVERLYALSQEMMLYEDAAGLIRDLPVAIERIFALEAVALYVWDQDRFYSSVDELPAEVKAGMRAMPQGHSAPAATYGGYYTTALMLGLRPVGALAWSPAALSHEVAAAVSAQVAIVLARSIAVETSMRVEAARESERLRTALIDSLTHELRTPLTSIRLASSTLVGSDGLDEAARMDLAAIIDEEAARLDSLIGAAVEMAEIDAHAIVVHAIPAHPRALLDQAVEAARKMLAGHRVQVVVDDGEGPARGQSVWFDPHLLGRVLGHLLENAARYTPPGSRITLSSRRGEGRLEFFVEDDGPGIDALELPLIFEKFYRGKQGATAGKGSGMGLAIARAILIAHGGAIEVESAPGKGTCFRFWVPLVEKEAG